MANTVSKTAEAAVSTEANGTKTAENKGRITVYVSPERKRKLRVLAALTDRQVSELVEAMIDKSLTLPEFKTEL